ncbi:teichoic acids export ABC transporter ATP-binding subunit TagH [Virgibacillus sp. MSJ-26]|uniref:teichoic acids export ABC transporter ATP-binding subunit TagH n=1 Tax=Virgibacillus sp. MSJ-26 TaxID=2841522 RepID=UPI00353008C9
MVTNVSKKYKLYNDTKERLLDLISPKNFGEDFYALRDVDFEAEKGDIVGFIGINGSGKSTLSNIIGGIVPQTSGTVQVNGEASLIAVSAGLKGDLTGRDNIELKCLMLGFNKHEIKEIEPSIIEFSELGDFIDQPVKSYSSGMKSRLGFSISINVNPEILIIDEALSVGDKAFAEKSLSKMKEFKKQGKTMIFVSHSIGQMKQFCEKILWLEFGRVKEYGSVKDVLPKYEEFLKRWKKMSNEERENYKNLSLNQEEHELKNLVDIESSPEKVESVYKEQAISRMGHIRTKGTYIYMSPRDHKDKFSSKKYKHSSYYIKRQAFYYNEKFYLLSNKPSGVDGVVGWMKASEVSSRLHIMIDNDPKTFVLKGTGFGYTRPWGGKKNFVFPDLKKYKDVEFEAIRTEKTGKHYWYLGKLDGQETWIHYKHLKRIHEK